jgi:hypothetical protein
MNFFETMVRKLSLHGARGVHHVCRGGQGCNAARGFERTGVGAQNVELQSDIALNLLVHAQLFYPVHHDPAKPHGSLGKTPCLCDKSRSTLVHTGHFMLQLLVRFLTEFSSLSAQSQKPLSDS